MIAFFLKMSIIYIISNENILFNFLDEVEY